MYGRGERRLCVIWGFESNKWMDGCHGYNLKISLLRWKKKRRKICC